MTERVLGATRATFASLRIRNFRLFFTGQLVSQIGTWLRLVAQTLLVLHLTGSGVQVGLLTAFQFGPVLLLGAWAGLVADRSDKRRLLLVVQSVAMLQSFALAALAFTDDPPVGAIFAIAAIGGVTVAFDNPARRAFVVEMVPAGAVNNAVSLNSAIMTSARVVGPAIAGLLITTVGYGWCFLLDGLSYLAVLAALAMMRTSELRRSPVAEAGPGQVRQGPRYVARVPDLWIPLAMMAVIGTLAFNFQVVMPLMIKRDFGRDEAAFTLFFSVLSVGSLVGALARARRTAVGVGDLVRSSAQFGAAMLVLAVTPSFALAFPVGLVVGYASIGFMTASTAIVQVRAEPAMRGRVLALQAIVFLGSTPIGGPIVGAVAEAFGARAGVALGGVAALAAAAFGTLAARRASARAAERHRAGDAVHEPAAAELRPA